MPHTSGPYVKHPRKDGFRLCTAGGLPLADVPPHGWVGRNNLGRQTIEANANLFAAAPSMLIALQAVILDTSIEADIRELAQHAIDAATKGVS